MPVKPNDQGQDNTPVQAPQTPQEAPVQAPQTPQEAPAEPVQTPQASDTTIPGGKYLVNGVYVDANGEPLK